MGRSFPPRVRVNSSTTGTGTLTLGAAIAGHQTVPAAADGLVIDYVIVEGTSWEEGFGTYTHSGTTLTRNLIASSSGALVSFSGGQVVSSTISSQSAERMDNGSRLGSIQRFTSSGTYTKPAGLVFAIIKVQAGGGGGGGVPATSSTQGSCGGGGGGGGYAEAKIDAADIGATETVTIGAGGAGSTGANGAAGGTSSITVTGGSTLQATGGGGGRASTATTAIILVEGAAPGVGSNGDLNISGGGGAFGWASGNGATIYAGGGAGGSAVMGGGGRSKVGNIISAAGVDAGNYGGGGSGAYGINTAPLTAPGGDGGDGVIEVWEYF